MAAASAAAGFNDSGAGWAPRQPTSTAAMLATPSHAHFRNFLGMGTSISSVRGTVAAVEADGGEVGGGLTSSSRRRRRSLRSRRSLVAGDSVAAIAGGEGIPQAPTPARAAPAALLNTTWKVHRVSPLYDCDTSPRQLSQYARELTAALEAARVKLTGVAVDVPESERVGASRAQLALLPGVALYEGEAEAVRITVARAGAGETETQAATGTPALQGILCSVGSPLEPEEGFVSLPVLLLKGPAALTRQVIDWLQARFDCRVAPLHFPPHDLIWIATEWAAAPEDAPVRSQKPLDLLYEAPAAASGLKTISLAVEAARVRALKESVATMAVAAENNPSAAAQVDAELMAALERHFFAHFSINLSAMQLVRVGTYAAFVGAEGRLKLLPPPPAGVGGGGVGEDDALLVLQYVTYMVTRDVFAEVNQTWM